MRIARMFRADGHTQWMQLDARCSKQASMSNARVLCLLNDFIAYQIEHDGEVIVARQEVTVTPERTYLLPDTPQVQEAIAVLVATLFTQANPSPEQRALLATLRSQVRR